MASPKKGPRPGVSIRGRRFRLPSFCGVWMFVAVLLAGNVLAVLLVAWQMSSWQNMDPFFERPGNAAPSLKAAQAMRWEMASWLRGQHAAKAHTMVLYIFSDTDPEFRRNLQFFVKHGMREGDDCDYFVIVQGDTPFTALPKLPSNGRYMRHANECYDWGTIGWFLGSGTADVVSYKYYIFLNSSVRGPFLPPYLKGIMHWTYPLLSKLNRTVRLVGPTISCQAFHGPGGKIVQHPHVQSYVVATNQGGLKALIEAGTVLQCHTGRAEAIYHGELMSSMAMFQHNYTIDSLMHKYQGVDWRDAKNWKCNNVENPLNEHMYDGASIDPYEVMFVKVKAFMLSRVVDYAMKAIKITKWDTPGSKPTSNDYLGIADKVRLGKLLEVMTIGQDCFDVTFYRRHNLDLNDQIKTNELLWRHFVFVGQFEYRPYRYSCSVDYTGLNRELNMYPMKVLQQLADSAKALETTAAAIRAQEAAKAEAQQWQKVFKAQLESLKKGGKWTDPSLAGLVRDSSGPQPGGQQVSEVDLKRAKGWGVEDSLVGSDGPLGVEEVEREWRAAHKVAVASKDAKGLVGFEAGEEAERLDWGRPAPAKPQQGAQAAKDQALKRQGAGLSTTTGDTEQDGKAVAGRRGAGQ